MNHNKSRDYFKSIRAVRAVGLLMLSCFSFFEMRGAPDFKIKSSQDISMLKSLGITDVSIMSGVTSMHDGDHKSIEVFLVKSDDVVIGPVVLWVNGSNQKPILVDSISSINRILSSIQTEVYGITTRDMIDSTMSFVRRQYLVIGPETGIPLFGTYRTRFLRKLADKLPEDRVNYLLSVLMETAPIVTEKTWKTSWIEVDRQGGAERVIASGDVTPWKIRSISRELLLEPGEIPIDIAVSVYRDLK